MMNEAKQKGVVLVISLIFLTILTIIVLAANTTTIMQEKMTTALKDAGVALERAEHALREAENFLDTTTELATIESQTGYFALGQAPDPFSTNTWDSSTFTASNGAQYFIENVGTVFDESNLGENTVQVGDVAKEQINIPRVGFRIVARGTVEAGDQLQAQRLIVSYFAKRF